MELNQIAQSFNIPAPIQAIPLSGGANNRVYKLEFDDQEPLVLKQYFQHPHDPRPRLQSEFSFLRYAWSLGHKNIPQPLKMNPASNCALYTFIPGRPVQISDLSENAIQQLLQFFIDLNRDKRGASLLTKASESCFTIQAYLDITEKRMGRLAEIRPTNLVETDCVAFFQQELFPTWIQLKEKACKAALHLSFLNEEDRCISPSDFGFHNALLRPNETLCFIDFEYAGWDDPCKTVCDLFCQPKVPIPEDFYSNICQSIASVTSNPEKCLERIEIAWPIMQMKWCCILLNAFTQIGKNRREFSHSDEIEKQERQLNQAKKQLKKIQDPHGIQRFYQHQSQ